MSDIADVIKLVNKETEREDISEEIKQYLFCDLRHKLWKMDTIMPKETFRTKEYSMSDGRTAVFEYDHNGVGKITLENMDKLMEMLESESRRANEKIKSIEWKSLPVANPDFIPLSTELSADEYDIRLCHSDHKGDTFKIVRRLTTGY